MKLSALLVINAVIALIYGVLSLLVPETLAEAFGVTLDSAGSLAGRYAGSGFLALGLASWLARNAAHSDARLALVRGLAVGSLAGALVSLGAALGGATNALGWVNVVLMGFLAVGFTYYGFVRPGASIMGETPVTTR